MSICRATIEYDGSAYNGWQIQKNGPSVQGELEKAVLRLTGTAVRVKGAGRTDAGVHARGQTAAFPLPSGIPVAKIPEALNSRLPDDIAVTGARAADDAFDPRRDCILKQYSYSFTCGKARPALARRRSWHVKWPLDVGAMGEAAAFFAGARDFTSFCNQERAERDNVRDVERSELLVLPPDAAGRVRLAYIVEGRSFLYNMVRTIAGTLAEVGMGRFSPGGLADMAAARNRAAAGQTAPPWGLCLEWTLYPGDPRPDDFFGKTDARL